MTGHAIGLVDGTRLVVRSGDPTPEEAAALVVALDTVLEGEHSARRGPASLPAWRRAAYLEGAGGAPISSPAHLAQGMNRSPTP